MALPTRARELLRAEGCVSLVITVSPWDRCLWLYSPREWEEIDRKLLALPDGDMASRRAKQVMRGYASDCVCDAQGRVLLSAELRQFARLQRHTVLLGQGNKLELWDADEWHARRDEWLTDLDSRSSSTSQVLATLSL